MLKEAQEFIQNITDEVIAIGMIGSGIGFIYLGIALPEWFAVSIGLVMMHYFQKK